MLLNGIVKHFLSLGYLFPDLWQIRQLERRAIFVDQSLDIQAVKLQVIILYGETFLRKIEGLFYEVGISIVHLLMRRSKSQ